MRGATEHGRVFLHPLRFQSTHPVRGATDTVGAGTSGFDLFQSTHPVRGATGTGDDELTFYEHFNPRTP